MQRPGAKAKGVSIEPIVTRIGALEQQISANQATTLSRLENLEQNITRLWELEEQLTLTEVRERATAALEYVRRRRVTRALVITHGGVIRTLLAWALGLPLARCARLEVGYGSLSGLKLSGRHRQVSYINR